MLNDMPSSEPFVLVHHMKAGYIIESNSKNVVVKKTVEGKNKRINFIFLPNGSTNKAT
jgi:hypothetical protein